MAEESLRYGDADLAEFKKIILKKLEQAKADALNILQKFLNS